MRRFAHTSRLALAVALLAAMILPAGILAPAASADAPAATPTNSEGGGVNPFA